MPETALPEGRWAARNDDLAEKASPPYAIASGPETATIYALVDPTTDCIRYVGKTTQDPRIRLNEHVNHPTNAYTEDWITNLRWDGHKPVMRILEECSRSEVYRREVFWIRYMLDHGCSLLNVQSGGPTFGNTGPLLLPLRPRKAKPPKPSESRKDKRCGKRGYSYVCVCVDCGHSFRARSSTALYCGCWQGASRTCIECQKEFEPKASGQKMCRDCINHRLRESRPKKNHESRPRICTGCYEWFHPKKGSRARCEPHCGCLHPIRFVETRTCVSCGEKFVSFSPRQIRCSMRCRRDEKF